MSNDFQFVTSTILTWGLALLFPGFAAAQKHPVSVTPGTPSVWSMEQAHYLLNRVRSSNDGLRTKMPGENDLDPNAVNGLHLDAVQSFLGVSGAFDTSTAALNKIALGNFADSATRQAVFQQKVDQLQSGLFQENLKLADLKGKQKQQEAQAEQTGTSAKADPVLQGQIEATQDRIDAISKRITALSTAAGQAPTSPVLNTVTPDPATGITNSVLKGAADKLLAKTADQFSGPRLAASTALDNFVQMQYEIVSKQLTALRDEAGEGQRIVFLEIPTSVAASAPRLLVNGGENKLAQSWWRINAVVRRYDKDRSACWAGVEHTNMLDSLIENQGARLSAVPEAITLPQNMAARLDDLTRAVRAAKAALQKTKDSAALDSLRRELTLLESRRAALAMEQLTVQVRRDPQTAPPEPLELLKQLKDTKRAILEAEHELRDADPQTVGVARSKLKELRKSLDEKIDALLQAETDVILSIQHEFLPRSLEDPRTIALIDRLESPCKKVRAQYEQNRRRSEDQLSDLRAELAIDKAATKPDNGEIKRLGKEIDNKQDEMKLEREFLGYDLEPHQLAIFEAFCGPEGLRRAFLSPVHHPGGSGDPQHNGTDTHLVRAIEVIPRQTALNINQTNTSTRDWAFMAVLRTISGFGAKANLQLRHEMYDQFMKQEVFASGFGKGETTFGWTFGPTPGTRVLNPGTRNTYAVLAVPEDATALEMEALGCGFHKNTYPPSSYPSGKDLDRFWCENQAEMTVAVPDRDTSGGFWVDSVQYSQVKPGERASVVLQGSYFSPQTTVLLNGKRLTQVLGLGKPFQAMDNGQAEAAQDGVISGSYEFVNEHYLALALDVPAGYKETRFPQITLISPARTANINALPLVINRLPGKKLANEDLLALAVTQAVPSAESTEFKDGVAVRVPVQLTGISFAPSLRVWMDPGEGEIVSSYYQTPELWKVVVENPKPSFTLMIRDSLDPQQTAATPLITRPNPPTASEKPKTKHTEIENSVTAQ